MAGQKVRSRDLVRYKYFLLRRKIKPFLLENLRLGKDTREVSVGSRARLKQAQNWSWQAENHTLILEFNKLNKQNVSETNCI